MKRMHLLFVYNADSDLFSSVTGFVHKIISPQTYNCNLCTLTYGNLTMKQEWKNFLEDLPVEKTFLHKNEFEKQYKQSIDLPAIFYVEEGMPIILIPSSEINHYHSLDQLMAALPGKIKLLKSNPA